MTCHLIGCHCEKYDIPTGGGKALPRRRASGQAPSGLCQGASRSTPACLPLEKCERFFLTGGSQARPRRGPGRGRCAQVPDELSLSKCRAWADRNSMLHGFPLCPMCLKLHHFHQFGHRVLGNCPGMALYHLLPVLFQPLHLLSKFCQNLTPPPGVFPFFQHCDQGIRNQLLRANAS